MNKQIEEMAIILSDGGCKKCDCDANGRFNCKLLYDAELLYKAGYRKFSGILDKMEEWHEYYEELYQTAEKILKTELVTEIISDIEQAIMAHGTNYTLKRLEEIKKKYGVEKDEKAD